MVVIKLLNSHTYRSHPQSINLSNSTEWGIESESKIKDGCTVYSMLEWILFTCFVSFSFVDYDMSEIYYRRVVN